VIAVFAVLACAAVTANAVAHRGNSRLVSLGTLLQTILVRRSVRITIVLFWWWIGWHFLVER
jgi:hypothetical protein